MLGIRQAAAFLAYDLAFIVTHLPPHRHTTTFQPHTIVARLFITA